MRLGTKILILTLAITLGLAGIIVWVVTRDLTAHETSRAQADIRRAVSDYFDRIESLHRSDRRTVRLLLEDPHYRAQLELLDQGDESTKENFRLLFKDVLQTELTGGRPTATSADGATQPAPRGPETPAFYVVLNFEGNPLLTFAPDDGKLTDALSTDPIEWPYAPLLEDDPVPTRRYVWVNGGLYLALGFSLRIDVSGPPTHAYFIGYRIDDPWVESLLGDDPDKRAVVATPGSAGGRRRSQEEPAPLHAWFVVDRNVVARGMARETGASDDPYASVGSSKPAESVIGMAAPSDRLDVRQPIEFDAAGERFVGESVTFSLGGEHRGALAVASSLTRALGPLKRLQTTIMWVTVGVLVVAVIAFRFVSNLIARPVRELVEGTRRVAEGEFEKPIVVNRRDELGELARSFNDMATGLRQRDLVKSTFGKFVDPKVVEGFLADPTQLMPGGTKRVQSVLFSDIAGFTSFAERLEPDQLVALLNGYLGDAADIVTGTRGIVDKFIGDAVASFWGPPITREQEHAGLACLAGLRIVRSVRRLDAQCNRLGVRPLSVRVGVATGDVLVGIIGSANKYNYTVMGDTANLASRLEGMNKLYGTSVLVSERTAQEATNVVVTRRVDHVRVVGRAEPVGVYEVLAERGEANGTISLQCEAYAEAMSLYESRKWSNAASAFERMLVDWPQDGAALAMSQRCVTFKETDPGDEWDGVWNATNK